MRTVVEFYDEQLTFNGKAVLTPLQKENRLKKLQGAVKISIYFGDQSKRNEQCYQMFVQGLQSLACHLKVMKIYFSAQARMHWQDIQDIGEGMQNLANNLVHLTLAVSMDSVSSSSSNGLSNWLMPLVNLEELHLVISCYSIPEVQQQQQQQRLQHIHGLAHGIKYLQKLKQFHCSCRLNTTEASLLLSPLIEVHTLELLKLETARPMPFGEDISQALHRAIWHNQTTLIELDLQIWTDSPVQLNQMNELAQAISCLACLKVLRIAFGEAVIGCKGFQSLAGSFQRLSNSLEELYLLFRGNNDIGHEGAQSLGSSLAHLTVLKHLEISVGDLNHLKQQGIDSICMGLRHLTNVTTLVLQMYEQSMNTYNVEGLLDSLIPLQCLVSLTLQLEMGGGNGNGGGFGIGENDDDDDDVHDVGLASGAVWNPLRKLVLLKKLRVLNYSNVCSRKLCNITLSSRQQKSFLMRKAPQLVKLCCQ